ncbi:MAG: hypothetical protein LBR79_03105 [Oscillospiraceae bacterium]|nr:hypothetical protein [Oscillospiraceae bacterium]
MVLFAFSPADLRGGKILSTNFLPLFPREPMGRAVQTNLLFSNVAAIY